MRFSYVGNQVLESSLFKVRSHLASGVKSAQVISHCERELHEAKMSIHALQALAEIEGDTLMISKQRKRLERDVTPLYHEILQMKQSLSIANVHQPIGAAASATKKKTLPPGGTKQKENEMTSLFAGRNESSTYIPPKVGITLSEQEALIEESRSLLMESQA